MNDRGNHGDACGSGEAMNGGPFKPDWRLLEAEQILRCSIWLMP